MLALLLSPLLNPPSKLLPPVRPTGGDADEDLGKFKFDKLLLRFVVSALGRCLRLTPPPLVGVFVMLAVGERRRLLRLLLLVVAVLRIQNLCMTSRVKNGFPLG